MIRKSMIIVSALAWAVQSLAAEESHKRCDYSFTPVSYDETPLPSAVFGKNKFDKNDLMKIQQLSISRRTSSYFRKARSLSEHLSVHFDHQNQIAKIRQSETEDFFFNTTSCERDHDRILYRELMSLLSRTTVDEGCGRIFPAPASLAKPGWAPYLISITMNSNHQLEYTAMTKAAESEFIRLLERESRAANCPSPSVGPLKAAVDLERVFSVLFLFDDRTIIQLLFAGKKGTDVEIEQWGALDDTAREVILKPGMGTLLRKELAEARLENSAPLPLDKDSVRITLASGSTDTGFAYQGPSPQKTRLVGLKKIFEIVKAQKAIGFAPLKAPKTPRALAEEP